MIGTRVLAAATIIALAVVLGGGAPRPEIARGANAAIASEADRTLEAIHRLETRLAPVLDDARAGAARVVAGNADPVEPLSGAAEGLLDAAPELAAVHRALADLEAARIALRPDAESLPAAPDAGELPSIAAQLGEAAEAGAGFAETRRRAESLSAGLVEALDSAAAGRPDEASERLAVGLVAIEELGAWVEQAPVLSVWIDTADAMIRAMQRLVDAVRADDSDEAAAAQADFAAVAQEAPAADRALRIGVGEAGSSLTGVPLRRLAELLRDLDALEAAVRAAPAEVGG